jgi:hypothetical protein
MIIGIDFDNTIVNYLGVFHEVAVSLNWISDNVAPAKSAVKQCLVNSGQGERWTALQGIVYGNEIHRATLYPSCKETLEHWLKLGYRLCIVSHKTRYPVIGEQTSLQDAATRWLHEQKIIGQGVGLISPEDVYYGETLDAKLGYIRELKCDVFIDDLLSVFEHESFPSETRRILFQPEGAGDGVANVRRGALAYDVLRSWGDAGSLIK